MCEPLPRYIAEGCTLRTIEECRERLLREFDLEEAREEARLRKAQVYQGPIPKWGPPLPPKTYKGRYYLGWENKGKRKSKSGPDSKGRDIEAENKERVRFEQQRKQLLEEQQRKEQELRLHKQKEEEKRQQREAQEQLCREKREKLENKQREKEEKKHKQLDKKRRKKKESLIDVFEEELLLIDQEPLQKEQSSKDKDTKPKKKKKSKTGKASHTLDSKSRKNLLNEEAAKASGPKPPYKCCPSVFLIMCDLPPIPRKRSERSISQNGDGKGKGKNKKRGSGQSPVATTVAGTKPSKIPSGPPKEDKNNKNRSNEQQQMRGRPCSCPACTGTACGTTPSQGVSSCTSSNQYASPGQSSCPSPAKPAYYCCDDPFAICGAGGNNGLGNCDELDAIEEESVAQFKSAKGEKCGTEQIDNSCNACNSCPKCNPTDDDACGEFFEVMRDSMEDAVKKSLEGLFSRYFCNVMDKLQGMASQMEGNECLLSKIFTDLNDKISYYGERNAQQFQYLCVRMEHDRLFYQQQQEYFLKQSASNTSKDAGCRREDSQQVECRCCQKSDITSGSESESRHKKGRYWDCTLDPDDMTSPRADESTAEDGGDEDDDKGRGKKGAKGKPAPSKSDTGSKKKK